MSVIMLNNMTDKVCFMNGNQVGITFPLPYCQSTLSCHFGNGQGPDASLGRSPYGFASLPMMLEGSS